MQRGIQSEGNKVRYLVAIARNAMLRYCGQIARAARHPARHGYYEPLQVLSLDAPLSEDGDQTLLDLLTAEECTEEDEMAQDGFHAAYECHLDSLPV
jgi:hypothetical protein